MKVEPDEVVFNDGFRKIGIQVGGPPLPMARQPRGHFGLKGFRNFGGNDGLGAARNPQRSFPGLKQKGFIEFATNQQDRRKTGRKRGLQDDARVGARDGPPAVRIAPSHFRSTAYQVYLC